MIYLLDSNIFIYASKGEEISSSFIADLSEYCFCSISMVEVLGYHSLQEQEKQRLEVLFYNGNEIEFTQDIKLYAIELRQSKSMSLADSIIAASALTHGLNLASRNVSDFRHISNLVYSTLITLHLHKSIDRVSLIFRATVENFRRG